LARWLPATPEDTALRAPDHHHFIAQRDRVRLRQGGVRVLVASQALKEDFDNGEPYVPFHGTTILLPERETERPLRQQLEWHNDTLYRG
jgi:predicted restriction endonuclease